MQIKGSVVLVTGANRGLGFHFAQEALARGARKVYAAARDPSKVSLPGVVSVKLDVTNAADVASVAERCTDVTLLINNAGIALRSQATQVVGFHAGFIDTDLTRAFEVPKAKPEDVVRQALNAVEAGEEEVLVDEPTRQVRQGLSHGVYLKDVMAA